MNKKAKFIEVAEETAELFESRMNDYRYAEGALKNIIDVLNSERKKAEDSYKEDSSITSIEEITARKMTLKKLNDANSIIQRFAIERYRWASDLGQYARSAIEICKESLKIVQAGFELEDVDKYLDEELNRWEKYNEPVPFTPGPPKMEHASFDKLMHDLIGETQITFPPALGAIDTIEILKKYV